jgi:hypothetical protein
MRALPEAGVPPERSHAPGGLNDDRLPHNRRVALA